MGSGKKKAPVKKAMAVNDSHKISVEKAQRMVDKNSKTIIKIVKLQEILDIANGSIKGALPMSGIEQRMQTLKFRLNRRLLKLTRWVDLPESKRQPEPEMRRQPYNPPRFTTEKNIFARDSSMQSRVLQPGANPQTQTSKFPHSINSLAPSVAAPIRPSPPIPQFRPGNLLKEASQIMSLQKKLIDDAISGQMKSTSTGITPPMDKLETAAPQAVPEHTYKSITVKLPEKN